MPLTCISDVVTRRSAPMPHPPAIRRGRSALILVLIVVLLVFSRVAALDSSAGAAVRVTPVAMRMSADEMRGMIARHFAVHPAHGASTQVAAADSFLASGFIFNEDNNASTQVDTAHISKGQAILFKWVSGFHTATSGEGSSDPNTGVMFDRSLTSAAESFTFQYDTVGTFPFYCLVHESSNMRGVVVVRATVAAPPIAVNVPRSGFVAAPWPNPTRAGVSCRIALARAGRARLEVLDAQSRRVA